MIDDSKPVQPEYDGQYEDLHERFIRNLEEGGKRVQARYHKNFSEIVKHPPEEIYFQHSILCQLGLPRNNPKSSTFERRSNKASLLLEAGKLWDGEKWVEQPLPYGTKPRLILYWLITQAVRTQCSTIGIGDSAKGFLEMLKLSASGGRNGGYTGFKKQMLALAACRMTVGITTPTFNHTIEAKPIENFQAWLHTSDNPQQRSLWPGYITLSDKFFDSLINHAVPLDYRSLLSLQNSALALDIYTWLATRLHRIKRGGEKIPWDKIIDQFGQEYGDKANFRKEFKAKLSKVLGVYREAKVEQYHKGFILHNSPPPIPAKTQIVVENGVVYSGKGTIIKNPTTSVHRIAEQQHKNPK